LGCAAHCDLAEGTGESTVTTRPRPSELRTQGDSEFTGKAANVRSGNQGTRSTLHDVIYTTNVIQSLNYQLRKVTKNRGQFPSSPPTVFVANYGDTPAMVLGDAQLGAGMGSFSAGDDVPAGRLQRLQRVPLAFPRTNLSTRQRNNYPYRGASGLSWQSACAGTPFATVGLDGLHCDAGVHSGDGGISHQLGGEPVFVSREIRDLDPNDVVRNSEHAAQFGNFAHRGDPVLERFDGGEVFCGEVGMDDDLETSTDRVLIDDRDVSGDDAVLLKAPHSTQARSRRQSHSRGQLQIAQPPVALQLGNDCAIQFVHAQYYGSQLWVRVEIRNQNAV